MKELLFILGLIIGSLVGVTFMCMLQVNKINEYEKEIELLKKR